MPAENQHLRNFSIIAHIDHGKSTLSDRLLEKTGTVSEREAHDQFLDNMELERERGITIKAQSVRMNWRSKRDGKEYVLNLIDTPGHVDFAYEVSRSLSACEGAVLVVDASQGVEAQTLANVYLALEHDLAVVPVINKIDLPSADVEGTRREIEEVIGLDASRAVPTSAKEGTGIEELIEEIIHQVPPPKGDTAAPLRALIFDSWYESYSGVFKLIRLVDGTVRLRLNDSAFVYEPETSQALGFGFRCGYLGLLHMDIVQERLEREYGLNLITTAPSVVYKIVKKDGSEVRIDNPAKLPPEGEIEKFLEPMLRAHIYVPNEYVGAVLQLCQDRRGTQKDIKYIGTKRVQITYEIPLAEVVFDFFDKLKSISRGYASLDYEPVGYQEADLVRLDILINGEPVDALSTIVHRERA